MVTEFDLTSPLSVGNGEFAFTADPTGLQTFAEAYEGKMPLCTMSQWGWHTIPAAGEQKSYEIKDYRLKMYDTYGRKVGYITSREGQEEEYNWIRQNPHRLHLGRIGLKITIADDKPAKMSDLKNIHQTLDLWRGLLVSSFTVEGLPVKVKTCCHPTRDLLAVSIESPLLTKGSLAVEFSFSYGSPEKAAADWSQEDKHRTEVIGYDENQLTLLRILDADHYFNTISFSAGAKFHRQGKHSFILEPQETGRIEFVSAFTPYLLRDSLPSFTEIVAVAATHWKNYWTTGGMVELAKSKDPRGFELERRVILSQYLTAIQCAGSLPPAETGLTCNSWYGKFHLEMHWWHAAHFGLWGRIYLLEKSLWWYQYILEKAKDLARTQGYAGARWPKMVGPDGLDSPSSIGPLLIWQQPHPIYYAELCYRAHPNRETLERYQEIVFNTADFLASYAVYEEKGDRYVLGPPVIPAQECHRPEITINPTFELAYWALGLELAIKWRERLDLSRKPVWEQVLAKLSPLPEKDQVYLAHENCPDTFSSQFNHDHPSMLCALGVLPGWGVDHQVMLNTLQRVITDWQLEKSWGWDFPVIAMTAARLGRQELAVDALLRDSPKNVYLPNGHNCQLSRDDLPLYLPGNGGLLMAVAMMAAGWDGGPDFHAPGFPQDGSWTVTWEGLSRML